MRSLSSALNTAYGYAVQKPAWFVEVSFAAATEYYSSYSTVTWNSQSWTARDIDVSSIRVGALEITGAIVFGNADDVMGAKALASYFQNRRIRIWGYDGSMVSPAVGDPFLFCDGIGGGASIAADRVSVAIHDFIEAVEGPRTTVSPAFGFYTYLPAGKVIRINGIDYTVER
ncbi:MAG TPA: hypothetical protein PLW68_15885 [Casimicrobiaceae bacterium]|nr:hypothetical protein [Casimicrobiaceae bacterium]